MWRLFIRLRLRTDSGKHKLFFTKLAQLIYQLHVNILGRKALADMEEVLIIFAIPDHVGLSLVFGRMFHVTKFTSKDICALVCVNSRHFLTLTWLDSHLTGDHDKGPPLMRN